MKVLEKAESDFDNVVYLTFEVTNKQIADLLSGTDELFLMASLN